MSSSKLREGPGVANPAIMLFRSKSVDEATKKYIDKYIVVQPTIVRAGFARDSVEVTRLNVGDVIKVSEERFTDEQILRVKYKKGWVSVTSKTGKTLLERQDKKKRRAMAASMDTANMGPAYDLEGMAGMAGVKSSDEMEDEKRVQKRERKDSQKFRKAVILGDAEIRRREHQIGPLLTEFSLALKNYEKWTKAASKLFEAVDANADPVVELAVALGPPGDSNETLSSVAEEMVTALQEVADTGAAYNDAIREGILEPIKIACEEIKNVKASQIGEYHACRDEFDIALGRLQKLQRDSSIKSGLETKVQGAWSEVETQQQAYRAAETEMVSEVVNILGAKAKLEVDFIRVISEAQQIRAEAAVEALEVLQIHVEDL